MTVAALLVSLPLLLLSLGAGTLRSPGTCPSGGSPIDATMGATAGTDLVNSLDSEQMRIAALIVTAVRAYPATSDKPHAAVVALATARQESGIRNLPYGDRDSLGVFQQRPSQGWGTPAQILDVNHATTAFLTHLVAVPRWQTIPVTDAAARVQRPAKQNRGLYEQWVPLAEALTSTLWASTSTPNAGALTGSSSTAPVMAGTGATNADPGNTGSCPSLVLAATGTVNYPVPAELADTDQHNWGGHGALWASWHTGTDFAVSCGTPVLASTAGTIEVENGPAWFGTWLVKVVTGPDSVATWYAHMQRLTVRPGDHVTAGQQIGEAGAVGNTTGCHLHFEVHLRNGSLYGLDNTDPSAWLATHVGTEDAATTRVASFNVLGATHTQPGGNSGNHLDATLRMRLTVQALIDHQIDIVALQEFQPPQETAFRELTADTWAHYPDSGGRPGAANVVAWRTDQWGLVAAQRIPPTRGAAAPLGPRDLPRRVAGRALDLAGRGRGLDQHRTSVVIADLGSTGVLACSSPHCARPGGDRFVAIPHHLRRQPGPARGVAPVRPSRVLEQVERAARDRLRRRAPATASPRAPRPRFRRLDPGSSTDCPVSRRRRLRGGERHPLSWTGAERPVRTLATSGEALREHPRVVTGTARTCFARKRPRWLVAGWVEYCTRQSSPPTRSEPTPATCRSAMRALRRRSRPRPLPPAEARVTRSGCRVR